MPPIEALERGVGGGGTHRITKRYKKTIHEPKTNRPPKISYYYDKLVNEG